MQNWADRPPPISGLHNLDDSSSFIDSDSDDDSEDSDNESVDLASEAHKLIILRERVKHLEDEATLLRQLTKELWKEKSLAEALSGTWKKSISICREITSLSATDILTPALLMVEFDEYRL